MNNSDWNKCGCGTFISMQILNSHDLLQCSLLFYMSISKLTAVYKVYLSNLIFTACHYNVLWLSYIFINEWKELSLATINLTNHKA